jgi:Pyruvate/2-oxoacid:ferredoxin oxidoreductase delta subunit
MPPSHLSQGIDYKATQLSNALCDKCHQFSQKSFFFTRPHSSKHQSSDQRWGLWDIRKFCDIQKKKVLCLLCRLVCSSLALINSTRHLISDDDSIYYYRILFGTYEGKNSSTQSMTLDDKMEGREDTDIWNLYQTNRLHVSTNPSVLDNVSSQFARLRDSFGPPIEPPDGDADILLFEDDETNLEDGFLQGRRVGGKLDFDLCKSWLNICTGTHGESCMPVPLHEFPLRLSRVIDVERRMVVSAMPTCSYAALSYRWGEGVEQLELRQATLKRLTTPCGLGDEWDDIPHTSMTP